MEFHLPGQVRTLKDVTLGILIALGLEQLADAHHRRRALMEQLHRYESFTYAIDMVGKAAPQTCDRPGVAVRPP